MNFHVLCGLPRSGSTLLANLLAQHPDVHVHGTSMVAPMLEAVHTSVSNAPESAGVLDQPGGYDRYLDAYRGLIEGYYSAVEEPVVIDKGRGWIINHLLLAQLYPTAKLIVTVRDPRDVIASIERQHRATAAFQSPIAPTLRDAADKLMAPEGMIGGPIKWIEDLLTRVCGSAIFIRYESFARNPETTMTTLAKWLDLPEHEWDYEHIENISSDLDAMYRNKYPHEGTGPIKPPSSSWRDTMQPDLAKLIIERYPLYAQTFAYGGT